MNVEEERALTYLLHLVRSLSILCDLDGRHLLLGWLLGFDCGRHVGCIYGLEDLVVGSRGRG